MKFILLFISIFPLVGFAQSLSIPEYIYALTLDGKDVNNSFFSRNTSLELSSGKHILVLQYKEIFDDLDNDDHVTIKSKPFVVLFTVNQVENLNIVKPELIDEKSARAYAESPKITMMNEKNQIIPTFSQSLLEFEAQTVFKQLEQKTQVVESNDSSPLPIKAIQSSKGKQPNALPMLEYWWHKASDIEKEQFKKHILSK